MRGKISHFAPFFIGNCVAFPIKKALRVNRTAAERNLSLRDAPQAQNPAKQDSILLNRKNGEMRSVKFHENLSVASD